MKSLIFTAGLFFLVGMACSEFAERTKPPVELYSAEQAYSTMDKCARKHLPAGRNKIPIHSHTLSSDGYDCWIWKDKEGWVDPVHYSLD